MNKIDLKWLKKRSEELSPEDKQQLMCDLNIEASKYPKGFDFTLPSGKEDSAIRFIQENINCVAHILLADNTCISIYQNIQDMKNRENQR